MANILKTGTKIEVTRQIYGEGWNKFEPGTQGSVVRRVTSMSGSDKYVVYLIKIGSCECRAYNDEIKVASFV